MGTFPVDERPVIFAVSGYKNTGKTTVVSGVTRILADRGYKVAVIKHDGHDFEGDVPGTDSYRHMAAGAYATAVYSANRYLVHKKCPDTDIGELIAMFPEADMILIEGLKDSVYPKYMCVDAASAAGEISRIADRIEALYNHGENGEYDKEMDDSGGSRHDGAQPCGL